MVAMNSDVASVIASKCPVVAVVEDDDVFREYLTVLLRTNNCQVKAAACGRDLFDILATQDVDCVILDYNLTAENGLSIHERIKETIHDAPPIVMLTGERNERKIIKAFRGGISDYVLKDSLKSDELFRAVGNAIGRREQTRAQDAELSRLRRRSEFDDATGLYSRESINDRLAAIVRNRRAARCAVMLIALDNLDTVAERFGQVVAERALRVFVARLKKSLGPNDIGGRYDSSRFVSITDVDVRFKTTELTCSRLARELSFDVNFDTASFALTPCIGAAIYPTNGATMDAVLAAAEQSLKNARARGLAYEIAEGPDMTVRPPPSGTEASEPLPVPAASAPSPRDRATVPAERTGDRRSVPRQRVLKPGRIMLPDRCSAVECTIRDISLRGARLRVDGPLIIPERFDLILSATGELRHVVRCWQNGHEFGVQFE